ncbi:MAG: hypothetical protein OEL19_05450 [Sulfurimonas sp.]|nr:hypothetical protein [Sulfurimonas sp.]
MAYLIGLVVVGLFFLVLHYFTELTQMQKSVVTGVALFFVLFALAFNTYTDAQRDKMLEVVTKFNQNGTIKCDTLDLNNTNFTLSIGTYTFIGKEKTPFHGQMISVSKCE